MKRTHKGFTLVELLIVVAIIGVISVMMTMSSTDAVDKAGANTIVGNLNSMKTAAFSMYMDHPEIAKDEIVFGADTNSALTTLAKYLGKKSDILVAVEEDESTSTEAYTPKYGLVGKTASGVTHWFVVYDTTGESTGVKTQLASTADKTELNGTTAVTYDALTATGVTGFTTSSTYASLQVF